MEAQSLYRTPRAVAEDIQLIRKGGGMLADDDSLDIREVLFWLAGFVAEMYSLEVQKARGIIDNIDRRLWTPICLTPIEIDHVKGPNKPQPHMYAYACLDENILSSANEVLIKEVFRANYQLTKLPIATVRQASIGYSAFGKQRFGWAVEGGRIFFTLPFEEFNTENISALAVVMPTESQVVDGLDDPIRWLPEWTPQIRNRALELMGMVEQEAEDQVNNGSDRKSDKR